jgi:DNA-binding NarL/FixJ family response regulator
MPHSRVLEGRWSESRRPASDPAHPAETAALPADGTRILSDSGSLSRDVTVLVAVPSRPLREALVAAINAVDGFIVVAEATTDEQARALAHRLQPTLALVDRDLPDCGGSWTIQALRGDGLVEAAIEIGLRDDADTHAGALAVGALAYVPLGTAPAELLQVLSRAAHHVASTASHPTQLAS